MLDEISESRWCNTLPNVLLNSAPEPWTNLARENTSGVNVLLLFGGSEEAGVGAGVAVRAITGFAAGAGDGVAAGAGDGAVAEVAARVVVLSCWVKEAIIFS